MLSTAGIIASISVEADAVHAPPELTVTVYVVEVAGATVMIAVVSPVLHTKVSPPVTVSAASVAQGGLRTLIAAADKRL